MILAACGGNSGDDDATIARNAPPTATATYASSVPATAVVTLDGSASSATSGGTLTYSWALTSIPAGSTASIANPNAAMASLTTDLAGTYALTLTVGDGFKSQVASLTLSASAPTTILSDLVEPVSGVVQLSLSSAQGNNTVNWTVDGNAFATGAAVSWDTTRLADGNHVVVARIQSVAKYALTVTRTFQVAQSPVSFTSATITESAGLFIATVGAQSVNGILHVDGTLDGAALGTLGAPNACVGDASGAACAATGLNGYQFRGTVGNGAHTVIVTATDGAGRSLGTQLLSNVSDVQ